MNGTNNNITAEEVYRRLEDVVETLGRIEEQVKKTNGRTTVLEVEFKNIRAQLREVWARIGGRRMTPPLLPVGDPGESFSMRISPKMWMALAAGGGAGLTFALDAMRKWLERQ